MMLQNRSHKKTSSIYKIQQTLSRSQIIPTTSSHTRTNQRKHSTITMPTVYEARCLNCGNLGHYKHECPRTACRKCHMLGHTGSACHVKLPPVKFDDSYIIDKKANEEVTVTVDEIEGDDHLEKYYAS
mmetsp:Transcript_18111/g.37849  ORF Transcript_18111/g.37849 Transcript_18111/m.37849 type:complete len:128 (-) Transcript_18111:179-562(-)